MTFWRGRGTRTCFAVLAILSVVLLSGSYFHRRVNTLESPETTKERNELRAVGKVPQASTSSATTSTSTSTISTGKSTSTTVSKRRSLVWLVKEQGDNVEVLMIRRNSGDPLRVPGENSGRDEIPLKAAQRILQSVGLDELSVSFLTRIRHGIFGDFADLTSYVALIEGKVRSEQVDGYARSPQGRFFPGDVIWIPVSEVSKNVLETARSKSNLMHKSSQAHHTFSDAVIDDIPFVQLFLEPIVKTAGKNPAKCLGPKLGFRHDGVAKTSLDITWPSERS